MSTNGAPARPSPDPADENYCSSIVPGIEGRAAGGSDLPRAVAYSEQKCGNEHRVRTGLAASVIGTWLMFVTMASLFAWNHAWAFQSVLVVAGSGLTGLLAPIISFYFSKN